jgi:hypothetical protein
MINRDMQTVYVERMKDIIGAYGEEFNLNEVSEERVEKTLLKIADVGIKANVICSSTVKHALYNLENFRPEIRSAFEFQLFNVWHHVFKTLENDQSDRIEPGVLPPIVEKDSEVEEIAEEISVAQEAEPEVEEIAEEISVAQEAEPEVEEIAEEISVAQEAEPEVSLKRPKRDWFDLILDISAGFIQFLTRIVFKKRS